MTCSMFFFTFLLHTNDPVVIGIVDRVEDTGMAVILIEELNRQIELPLTAFDEDIVEGAVLELEIIGDDFQIKRVNQVLTKHRKAKSMLLLKQLRKKHGEEGEEE